MSARDNDIGANLGSILKLTASLIGKALGSLSCSLQQALVETIRLGNASTGDGGLIDSIVVLKTYNTSVRLGPTRATAWLNIDLDPIAVPEIPTQQSWLAPNILIVPAVP